MARNRGVLSQRALVGDLCGRNQVPLSDDVFHDDRVTHRARLRAYAPRSESLIDKWHRPANRLDQCMPLHLANLRACHVRGVRLAYRKLYAIVYGPHMQHVRPTPSRPQP